MTEYSSMQQIMTKPVTATATGTIALAGNDLNMIDLLFASKLVLISTLLNINRRRAGGEVHLFALSPWPWNFYFSFLPAANSWPLAVSFCDIFHSFL
jgi:hypothetical protein